MEHPEEIIENNETEIIAEEAIAEPKIFTASDMENAIKRAESLTETIEKQQELNKELRTKLQEVEQKYIQIVKENLGGMDIHSFVTKEIDGEMQEVEISVPIKFRFATPALRICHTQMLIDQNKEMELIKAKFNMTDWGSKNVTDLTPDEQVQYNLMQIELYKIDDIHQINFFKKIINDTQNKTDEKGLLRSNTDSEFYQNINKQELVIAIYSFRFYNNI